MTGAPDIIKTARGWIGTPYHHQAARRGIGCDCLGLVRGVYLEVTGSIPEVPPPYTPDWAEAAREETLIEAAARHLDQIKPSETAPGDVLIFRLSPAAMAKHAGVLVTQSRMVHAYSGRSVVEVHLGSWWRTRIAAAFRFPQIKD